MKKFIFLGIISLLLLLVIKTPAHLVSQQINQRTPLQLQGATGTLWQGTVAQASYKEVVIGAVEWSIDPFSVVKGKAEGHFKIKGDELKAKGEFELALDKKLKIKKLGFKCKTPLINKLANNPIKLTGEFIGDIDYLIMTPSKAPKPPIIKGQVNWLEGGINSPFLTIPHGNYQAIIEQNKDDNLLTTIESDEAALIIEGNIQLDQQWRYVTDLQLTPSEQGQNMKKILNMMRGRANDQGSYIIRENGSLSIQR
ncbi:MAG: type II secretion system protein N [Thiotrichaceae bacterium]|nr:type II secretion system protein N [Thiotrichaceae bacterium]